MHCYPVQPRRRRRAARSAAPPSDRRPAGAEPVPDRGPAAAGTDRWGGLPQWDRVHLVDGSVLPTVASTTFPLTVMATAHRIVTEVLAGRAVTRGQHGAEVA